MTDFTEFVKFLTAMVSLLTALVGLSKALKHARVTPRHPRSRIDARDALAGRARAHAAKPEERLGRTSAQQDSATDLASDSNAPKPPDSALSMSRNAVSSAATAAGAVRFISGLLFLESRQSEGKGGPPSFQTNNTFIPSIAGERGICR